MNQPFFREQPTTYLHRNKIERQLAVSSLSFAWLTAATFLVALAIVIFIWLGEYARKPVEEGYSASDYGVTNVYSLQPVSLIESKNQKRERINKNDPFILLSTECSSKEVMTESAIKTRLIAIRNEITLLRKLIRTQEKNNVI